MICACKALSGSLVYLISVAAVAIGLGATAPAKASSVPSGEGSYEKLVRALANMTLDRTRTAQITSLTLSRDVGSFVLGPGTLILCEPVNGRDVAAVFLGQGRFLMKPPTRIERDQLQRIFARDSIDQRFTELMLFFADSSASELESLVRFAPADIDREAQSFLRYALKYLSDEGRIFFDHDCLWPLLNEQENGFFYAHMSEERQNPYFFEVNPLEEEEVRFLKRYPVDVVWKREVVTQFHSRREYAGERVLPEDKSQFAVSKYTIEAEIRNDLLFKAVASMDVTLRTPASQWVRCYLSDEFTVDSILVAGGHRCEFYKAEEESYVWVHLEGSPDQEECTLNFFYRGELITKLDVYNWLMMRSSVLWYPQAGDRQKAKFDITYTFPSGYELVSIGERVSESNKDDRTVSKWVTQDAIRNASFNIGVFERWSTRDPELPPVDILINKSGHRAIATIEDEVRHDIVESIRFYSKVFGTASLPAMNATEIPYLHGEAFAGLIHLSWATFEPDAFDRFKRSLGQFGVRMPRVEPEEMILFRAHEVAHQWWGVGVDFQTYHDQWLSEGFAEYSGLWYTQLVLEDNEAFFRILKRWREQILSNREFFFGSGQEAGPIWLGYRTQGSQTYGDHNLIIYKKGAFVLHMLRVMLIDLKTMSEDRFKGLLKEFYSTYMGRRASTDDFRLMVEKYAGEDMRWFFEQWIYGVKIPRYEYASRVEERSDGRFDLHVRVRQFGVPDDFRMPVVLSVVLEDGRTAHLRINVSGSSSEFTVPGLPVNPSEVVFNDYESVLCEVDEVGW
jgi:hypothetical protein